MKRKPTQNKQIVHVVDNDLLQAVNPVTVNLIGAGGTGSHVLSALGRLNYMLIELGHPGLFVRLYDDDIVEQKNRLRMLLTSEEVGLYKAAVLMNRHNRFFGTNWKAITERYTPEIVKSMGDSNVATITISCVDSIKARFGIAEVLKQYVGKVSYSRDYPKYWLDFGNSKMTGQAILSTVGPLKQPESAKFDCKDSLPMVTDEYAEMLAQSEDKGKGYSCSTAGALEEQDLYINTVLAYQGMEILKKMFRQGMLFDRGFFMNLETYRTQPIKVS